MMAALIISNDMINHDVSFYFDQDCLDNIASPFAAEVIVERGIRLRCIAKLAQSDLISLVEISCRQLAFAFKIETEHFISYSKYDIDAKA